MVLPELFRLINNLNTVCQNFTNIFQGIYGLGRIIFIPLWNIFKMLLWSMNAVDHYCTKIRVLSDEYLILRSLALVVNGLYNFLKWIIRMLAKYLLTMDYERDELLDGRERPLAPSKNPKIRSERIDNIIKGRKRDTEHYRRGYPGKVDSQSSNENVMFYKNQLSSCPEGDHIDNIHKKWWGNYRKLEVHHGYIQWLFPLREAGMNYQAKELQLHEAETIRSTPECTKRVLTSYKMMLDFYGLLMVNDETGELERASNWKERFKHLNRSFHNYLRITRILKSLGELGFENIKSKFVELMLKEIIQEGTLPNLFESCVGYWIMVLKDDQERDRLIQLAKTLCDEYNGVSDVNKEPEERAEDEVHLEKPPNDENNAVNNNGTLATDDKAASKI